MGELERLAREARRPWIFLTVQSQNEAAKRFYLRLGYMVDPLSPGFGRTGTPYEILFKALT